MNLVRLWYGMDILVNIDSLVADILISDQIREYDSEIGNIKPNQSGELCGCIS